jgi:site-specific recombinase XerD
MSFALSGPRFRPKVLLAKNPKVSSLVGDAATGLLLGQAFLSRTQVIIYRIMKLTISITFQPNCQKEQVVNMRIDTEKKEIQYLSDTESTKEKKTIEISTQSFQDILSVAIHEKVGNGRTRTAEAYQSALNSLNRFLHNQPLPLDDICGNSMESYQSYLKNRGVCMNTISFYMRILRTVYNKAVSDRIVDDRHPFEHVYTGVAKTSKRAISLAQIKEIRAMTLSDRWEQLAQHLFLFSFYTRGMAFVDMAYLRKDNLKDGVLHYVRRKTGQQISVRWERQMQEIVDKYSTPNSPFLLPIIKRPEANERSQFRYCLYMVNQSLNDIGKRLSAPSVLTMYVARHSWASIAKSIDVPLSIISEGMGHSSEKMTSIYLKSIEDARIDSENEKIISLIEG